MQQKERKKIKPETKLQILSPDGKTVAFPAVTEGIKWTTCRRGTAGRLDFTIIACPHEHFSEGMPVRLYIKEKPVFFGFIFTKKRTKERLITITAYDQLRYLKNKDTYVYENKTASELLQMISADFSLQTGEIQNTAYKIPSRIEENTTLFDMLENALDLTTQNTGKIFVLYDDFGRLTLKNISSMYVKKENNYLLIDEESGENFEYSSSIDSDTYNQIKLTYDNENTGKREVYIAKDGGNINSWGILQYYDTLKEGENGQAKANALLNLYNAKTRRLKITKAFGDCNVRAGSLIAVRLNLGDITVNNFMLVEKAVHTFKLDEHFMDLTLKGGEINA